LTGGSLKVLVTGASGFIGRRCLRHLVGANFEVHAVSREVGAPGIDADGVRWHRTNLLEPERVEALVECVGASHLFHAAWIATPGVFWNTPENLDWVAASALLVRTFYARGGKRVLGVGTCAEYEWVPDDCSERGTPLHPSTPYGQCKLAACLALEAAAGSAGGSWAWARLFFPYGPGEPPKRLIPAVVDSMLRAQPIDCTEGFQVRDFIYVEDVADALVKLLVHEATGVFNVGSGKGTSLRDVVALLDARIGGGGHVRFGARPAPAGDPPRVVADICRLRSEIGWSPAYTLEAGLDLTVAEARRAFANI
jgi:nucleoside-diphosphate-sugar epimerase